jgi:4'-phosphopantetheinyl transferase EntD
MTDELPQASLATLAVPGIAISETRSGAIEGELLVAELQFVANTVPRRVEEFRVGRVLARNALAQLGFESAPIAVNASRAPTWPKGVVGSITHCVGYCGAAVGSDRGFRAVGIDACPNEALFQGALGEIALPAEHAWVESSTSSELATDALVFAIKEVIFKLWSPLTGVWLGFEEAEVTVDLASSSYSATIHSQDRVAAAKFPETVEGRFTYDDSIILCQSYLKI